MQLRRFFFLIMLLLPFCIRAQDITGLWKGTLYNDTTGMYYKYEIGISKEKHGYSGFSHTWFIVEDKQYYGVKKVKIKRAADGKVIVEDDGLIANNYPSPPNKNVRQLNVLTLDASDSIMKLTGPFSTNRTKEYHSLTGFINLQRRNDFWQSSLVPHLEELGKAEELSFVKAEKEEMAAAQIAEEAKLAEELASAGQKKKEADAVQEKMLAAEKARQAALQKEAEEVAAQKLVAESAANEKAAAEAIARQKAAQAVAASEKQHTEQELAAAKEAQALKAKREAALAKQEAAKKLAAEMAAVEKQAKLESEKKAANERAIAEARANDDAAKQQAYLAQQALEQAATQKKLQQQNLAAAEVTTRKNVVQQTVNFSSDSLMLSLYDNGEVDGDTVSVLMNGGLILAKQGLSTNAVKHTIYIPKSMNQVELVMYAESLGTIPPNTGLLVIRDGKKLYEIRFSGDKQKNAAIIFNRVKD